MTEPKPRQIAALRRAKAAALRSWQQSPQHVGDVAVVDMQWRDVDGKRMVSAIVLSDGRMIDVSGFNDTAKQ